LFSISILNVLTCFVLTMFETLLTLVFKFYNLLYLQMVVYCWSSFWFFLMLVWGISSLMVDVIGWLPWQSPLSLPFVGYGRWWLWQDRGSVSARVEINVSHVAVEQPWQPLHSDVDWCCSAVVRYGPEISMAASPSPFCAGGVRVLGGCSSWTSLLMCTFVCT